MKGAEIGLCTSSRERLGTCYAEPTQRRVRIAGVERRSSGGWRGSRESLGLRPPPPRSAGHDSQKTAGYEHAKCGRYASEDRMWKTAGRRRRERAAYGRWRDRERLGRSLPACCRPATIPSNSPTERQRTTYDTQSPSALVEWILETYLSLLL